MSLRGHTGLKRQMTVSPQQHFRLSPIVQAIALILVAGTVANAAQAAPRPFSGDWFAVKGATRAATAEASRSGNLSGMPTLAQQQQLNPQLQRSLASFNQAASAIAAQQAAQAAARRAAPNAPDTVPDGLAAGGLVKDSQPLTQSWLNARNPTQSVDGSGQVTVVVKQTAAKSILSWQSFNIGKHTTLDFDQSGGTQSNGSNDWVVLNRINDPSGRPSQILGSINAQGSVYVLNRNGIIFGGASQVNVHSLIASAMNLYSNDLSASNTRFLNGGIGDLNPANVATDSILLTTNAPGSGDITLAPGAAITVGSQGLALIAAPNITNNAAITAPGGQVALVAGIGVSYDYNYSSLYALNGSKPQGTNDNSTTNLRFANYGKLEDTDGNDITPVGALTNNGLIYTPRGNITLLGGAIAQNGVVEATTSVAQPGSIEIGSQYEVGVNAGSRNPADESMQNFYTGAVSFGPQAVTSILPDGNGVTLSSDSTSLAPFQTLPNGTGFTAPLPTQGFGVIEVIGQTVDFKGGSLVYAPGQALSASTLVLTDPRAAVPALPGAGRLLLESGATLDVSGLPDVPLTVQDNLLTVRLSGNELADDPLQQDGVLYNMLVTVDMGDTGVNAETGESWVGSPLANLAGYANLVQRSIGQLLVNGGAIYLGGNEVIGAPGSTLNLDGGYLNFQGGMVKTTRLVNQYGELESIGSADPNDVFVGIAGQYTQDHARWGVSSLYDNPLIDRGMYVNGYLQGGNAGVLNIDVYSADDGVGGTAVADSGGAVLQSTLLADAVAGQRQTAGDVLPANGTFNFSGILPIEIGDADRLSAAALAALALPADFTPDAPLLAADDSPYTTNVFNSRTLDGADFKNISLTAGGGLGTSFQPITEDAGASLTVQPLGAIALKGSTAAINGVLTARGGSITVTSSPTPTVGTDLSSSPVPGDITLGSGAVLDVSGYFINDLYLTAGEMSPALPINGGSISLLANVGISNPNPYGGMAGADGADLSGNITLAAGSLLNLAGGGHVSAKGLLETGGNGAPLGAGGNLTLEGYAGLMAPLNSGLPPLERGMLTLDGTIDALGLSGGGVLTLQQAAMQIGGDPAQAAASGAYYFDAGRWGDLGFGGFVLNTADSAITPAGATVVLQHENLLPAPALQGAPSGAHPADFATAGLLAMAQRSPTNLTVIAGLEAKSDPLPTTSADGSAIVGDGAQILGDPGAAISISSDMATTVLGTLRAPGGSISLSMNAPNGSTTEMGPLYLGPHSLLDVSGTEVINPLATPVHTSDGLIIPVTGTLFPGGTVSLSDLNSAILMAPGAVINVSGASGAFDVARQVPGGALNAGQMALERQPVWSDAGQITIQAATALLVEGTLTGQGGGPQAEGGTLSLTGTMPGGYVNSYLELVEDTAQALRQLGAAIDLSTYIPAVKQGSADQPVDPKLTAGFLLFGADSLDGSGFASLNLNESGGAVAYAGQVALTLGDSVAFNTPAIMAISSTAFSSGGNTSAPDAGTALTVNAPYIAINGTSANSGGFPQLFPFAVNFKDAALTLNADQIDLSAFFQFEQVSQATFNSRGDIRLLPSQIFITGDPLTGALLTEGNLSLNAAEIYPATDTAFVLDANPVTATSAPTTITFGYPAGVTPPADAPLSAGGELAISATNVVQNGNLQAPFGTILLGMPANATLGISGLSFNQPLRGTQSVTLGAGSITSVSAGGGTIPYGETLDQTTWVYNPAVNNPTWQGATVPNTTPVQTTTTDPLTQAPQGVVNIDGASIAFNAGAVVDISGGGDLQAQEWTPGTGGSRDVLSQYNTSYANSTAGAQVPLYPDARQIYAILPGYGSRIAPYDATLSQAGMTPGQQIYLAGGPGLAAGYYTLLPAKYATLPGAFRVVMNSGVTNPLSSQPLAMPDGTLAMNGYLSNGFTGAHSATVSQFLVQSAPVWQRYSQYTATSANGFFPRYAALNNLAMPYVPDDAGRLVLAATSGLIIDGQLRGRPGPGGFGGQVDISSQYLKIIDSGSGTSSLSTGALDFSGPSVSNMVASGVTVSFSDGVAGDDIFTIAGAGTLVVPNGATAAQMIPAGGVFTLNNQSITLPAGDSLSTYYTGPTSIVVKSTGVDSISLYYYQNLTLPPSSSTAVTLPSANDSMAYSNASGSGGAAITVSSAAPFTVNGKPAPLSGGMYTTTAYGAGQTVQGTADNQKFVWTTGAVGSSASAIGAGGSLYLGGYDAAAVTLGAATAGGSATYQLAIGTTITALAASDLLSGPLSLQGSTTLAIAMGPGAYQVTSGQMFGDLAGNPAPVTFTSSAMDSITYSSGGNPVALPTSKTYLEIGAAQLDALEAPSLLIGGTRAITSAGTVITPTANGVIVANDATDPLAAPEIMLVAAPQFQSTTVQLDDEGNTASIMTPIADTGQVVMQSGSVVEAQGDVDGAEPATLLLGGTQSSLPILPATSLVQNISSLATLLASYYTALDADLGSMIRVSDGSPVRVQLPNTAQVSPGGIDVTDNLNTANPVYHIDLPSMSGTGGVTGAVIQSGAQVRGGNGLTLVSTGDVTVQSGAELSGNNITARSSGISVLGAGAAVPASGMVIDAGILAELEQAQALDLQSYGAIAFLGDVTFDMSGTDSTLTLGGGSLSGNGGTVSISAPTLTLDNELGGAAPTLSAGSGSLALDTNELIFADGAKSISGFGNAVLTAQQAIFGRGAGSMDFGALPVTLQTPTLIADSESNQTLTTTGALNVLPTGGAVTASDALGGAITLQGGAVTVAVPVQAQGGNIALDAGAGDVTLTGTGQLIAHGVAKQFGATTEYAAAGIIDLTAAKGTVDLQAGSVTDFAGAAGGGDGGTLAISTGGGTSVSFGGTLLGASAPTGAGGTFALNSAAAVDLDSLVQVLTDAGVSGVITVDAAQGDLSLSRTLAASHISLTADGGNVDVTGAINAHGTASAAGEIELYGAKGVDIEGVLTAAGSPNSPKAGGLINIGTTGTGSTTSLNAVYGYENVDPSASGVITVGPAAVIDAAGGTVTFRAPILDRENAQGANVNINIASGASVSGGAVQLDAYGVWSTADQSANPNQHFDGIVDPAGWYGAHGTLTAGAFTDIKGNPVATWDGATLVNQDGTGNSLAYYLANDYFAPTEANAAHGIFYGGFDPNGGTFDPAHPDAGSLPAFVQQPGFQLAGIFNGIANVTARPEIDLVNPGTAQRGVNGGDISVLTNWDLGAGVLNPDGSQTLAYRYQGVVAPIITLRAAGNVKLDASISDGFFQTADVSLPTGATGGPPTYQGAETNYAAIAGGQGDLSSLTEITFYNGTSELIGPVDPNIALAAPQPNGSSEYYQDYNDYVNQLYSFWGALIGEFQGYGTFIPLAAPSVPVPEPTPPAASDPSYAADYQNYLSAYTGWLTGQFNLDNIQTAGTPPPPAPALQTSQYENYVAADYAYLLNDINYLIDWNTVYTPYMFAPTAPTFIMGGGSGASVAPNANAPSNMGTSADPLPVQFAALMSGQSASYRIVAGAAGGSANPLAVTAPGAGSVLMDGHTVLNHINATDAVIVAPTTLRTGTGSIDIAAADDFELLDPLAPGVVYTAGAPAQAVADNGSSLALGQGAFTPQGGNPPSPGSARL